MDELGFDFNNSLAWFQHEIEHPYVLVRITSDQANEMVDAIADSIRRCYIDDQTMENRSLAMGVSKADIVAAKLPDPGSTMAGDFGEILGYFYQSTKELPSEAIGVKKWRLKQDRTKPAPQSDVVHFLMPDRPGSSVNDALLCAEVKMKSTNGNSSPIQNAIKDCEKDRTSRLAKTLVWLRDRALIENLGDIDLPLLDRFINLVDHPPITKRFRAVAVVCESLLDEELISAPAEPNDEFELLIIAVPNLKDVYEAAYIKARQTVAVEG